MLFECIILNILGFFNEEAPRNVETAESNIDEEVFIEK